MGPGGEWPRRSVRPRPSRTVVSSCRWVCREVGLFRQYAGRDIHFEDRLPLQVRRELEARGHELTNLEAWSLRVSGAHGILVDEESGSYQSGCCTRREGYAIGL